MNIFYMILAFVRPIAFIAAVIAFTVLMLKIARNNAKRRKESIHQLIDLAADKLADEKTVAASIDTKSIDETSTPFTIPKRISIDELIIPDDFMFKEEFKILKYMNIKYPEDCNITLYEPVSITTISMCEERMGIKFTDELKALYIFTNGMELSLCTLGFDSLETIESMYKTGYCDFEKEGDASDYVIVGDYLGCGDPIVMEKSTGKLYTVDHEAGEKSDAYTLKELLYWAIEFRAEELDEDDTIKKYLNKDF